MEERKKILVLGGTGAMGVYLVNILKNSCDVYVTTRQNKTSSEFVKYIMGNAHDVSFLERVVKIHTYDAIVDFMYYELDEFRNKISLFLESTKHYFFISSSRVYAESSTLLTESSPRLLDVSKDSRFLSTNDYSLVKAKEENVLYESKSRNWTIIRPYMTFDSYRMDLGHYPKELWLYRAIKGKEIIFPLDVANKSTTLTLGYDVAIRIASLIENGAGIGETYHITASKSYKWSDVIKMYSKALERHGISLKVKYVDKNPLSFEYIYQYDRTFNRVFDNTKIQRTTGLDTYSDLESSIDECINEFMKKPRFKYVDWARQALWDKMTNETTDSVNINSVKSKITYFTFRHIVSFPFIHNMYMRFIK